KAVWGCVAESVKSPAGITVCVDVPVRLVAKANAPVEFDWVERVRPKNGKALLNVTAPFGIAVSPSEASKRPLMLPSIDGSAARLLMPSAGPAKFLIAAISSGLSPASASGGS